ncbi:MAG: YeeE/YedE thiosulfate transporter family protein [Ignavibacteriae bacterium]|nr:YeeE/YedE thiosulfate transporter family protein [Ignavibacteriota bacterium]
MAPLVPDIIGNELNFIVAILIGIAFGFILEQAGFSTSKKLVGLFYGYDFTVLRVFFTAGVTAMIGVIALGHFGMLDLNLIYINPTFIWSAIVGGLIMGLGFVVGGFCPGTSICAAGIGKIDAMIFVGGSFLGVYAFAEGYPLFEGLYKAGNWGSPRIFEIMGMSQALFAFLLTFMAVFAFIVTTKIEEKVSGKKNPEFLPVKLYASLAVIAVLIGISAFVLPNRQEYIINQASNDTKLSSFNPGIMTIDELAFRILDEDQKIQIIDFRTPEQFKEINLPNSVNLSIESMFTKDAIQMLLTNHKKRVFVADDEVTEKKAAFIAEKLGFDEIYIVPGGLNSFKDNILNFKPSATVNSKQEADTYTFREKASKIIPKIIEENKLKQTPVKKETKRTLGGC